MGMHYITCKSEEDDCEEECENGVSLHCSVSRRSRAEERCNVFGFVGLLSESVVLSERVGFHNGVYNGWKSSEVCGDRDGEVGST